MNTHIIGELDYYDESLQSDFKKIFKGEYNYIVRKFL